MSCKDRGVRARVDYCRRGGQEGVTLRAAAGGTEAGGGGVGDGESGWGGGGGGKWYQGRTHGRVNVAHNYHTERD